MYSKTKTNMQKAVHKNSKQFLKLRVKNKLEFPSQHNYSSLSRLHLQISESACEVKAYVNLSLSLLFTDLRIFMYMYLSLLPFLLQICQSASGEFNGTAFVTASRKVLEHDGL